METSQFRTNVLELQANMLSFALQLTGNREDAYDLLQETTLRVLNNENKYVDNANFKGWVLTIMRNVFINSYRKMGNSQIIVDPTDDSYHLHLPQDSGFNSPDGAYTIKEINGAIRELGYDLRYPFSMYLAGYRYAEIANKMNMPVGTIKSRIFFARQELQKTLKDMR